MLREITSELRILIIRTRFIQIPEFTLPVAKIRGTVAVRIIKPPLKDQTMPDVRLCADVISWVRRKLYRRRFRVVLISFQHV